MWKGQVEWDEIVTIASAAYNIFPNSQGQGSSFFLMFGRHVYISTLANLLQPKLRYLGDASALLSVEMLWEVYRLAAVNVKKERDRQPIKVIKEIPKYKVSNLVLLRNWKKHTPLDAKYISFFSFLKS